MTSAPEPPTLQITKEMIDTVARSIGNGPIGLARHRPEPWADALRCFENVGRVVAERGGRILYGWTFHGRFAEKLPGMPPYLYATHHAVWHAPPKGELIDVTPYPDEMHRPLGQGGDPLFLLDQTAKPVASPKQIAPLPLRFFAIGDDPRLSAYVEELNLAERERCEKIYAAG
jgi:hypothetical protein